MLTFNDYLLYKEITTVENGIFEEGGEQTVSFENGIIYIDAKYCCVGLPLQGMSILNQKGKVMLKGDELQSVADKYASNDSAGAVEELFNILSQHEEELINPKEVKEAVEEKNDSDSEGEDGGKDSGEGDASNFSKYNFTLQIENAQLWPPKVKELKEKGLIIYLDFNVSLVVKKPQPSLQNFKINEIHFEGIGREVIIPIIKKILANSDSYIDVLAKFFSLFDKKSGKETVNDKVLKSKMKNEMNKSVKDNIDDIKNAPESEKNDETASKLTDINTEDK